MSSVSVQSIAGFYSLASFNGSRRMPWNRKATLSLSEGEGEGKIGINATFANTMNGQGTLSSSGVLKAMLVSTMMMGPSDLMKMEEALSEGLQSGFQVTLSSSGDRLTLKSGSNTFVYKRQRVSTR